MTFAYFDTSALVKNYIQESGSAQARSLFRSHRFLSSSITPVELMSALMRRKARRELAAEELPRILARARDDRSYWKLLDIGLSVLSESEELVQRTEMRTLDAIHVASWMIFQAASSIQIPFVTGDTRQRDAASRLGLDVVWIG